MSLFLNNIQEHNAVIASIVHLDAQVMRAGEMAAKTLQQGGKIMICGNGGSAADCQHLAAELTGRFIKDRRPLAAISLSTDTSTLTSIGNDYSFDEVFSRQVAGLGSSQDLLIGISTSGNSRNVVRAVEEAQVIGIQTLGLLGRDGGQLRDLCSHTIIVPSFVTARIQECHILIVHTLCGIIEGHLGLA
jgi:D-sedoheptulose 7-phosphate isomerase